MEPATAPAISPVEWASVALSLVLWLGVAVLLWRHRRTNSTSHPWLAGAMVTLASLCSAAVCAWLLTNHLSALVELPNQPWFVVPVILIAILAFFAKLNFGVAYGAIELIVAVLTLWFSIRSHNDSLLVKGLGLSSGIYIFVRGGETIRNSLARRA